MAMHLRIWLRSAAVLSALLIAWPAAGATSEITIRNTAMQRMLMDQLFTNHGKYVLMYASRCQFVYLESPAVAISRGRVRINSRLTGLLALEASDGCTGQAEVLDLTVSGRPYFSGENLGLTDIRIDKVSNELYRIALQQFLDLALPKALEIDLRQGLQSVIAGQKSSYDVIVSKLLVTNLTAEDNQIHANLSFSLLAQ